MIADAVLAVKMSKLQSTDVMIDKLLLFESTLPGFLRGSLLRTATRKKYTAKFDQYSVLKRLTRIRAAYEDRLHDRRSRPRSVSYRPYPASAHLPYSKLTFFKYTWHIGSSFTKKI
jgi:hypothetical protein